KFSEFRARQLSRAMLYYREAQINPEKAEEFEGWAVKELETARGERKIRIKAQLATYRQSQNLTDEQKRFVDETMDQAFSDVSDEAIKSGIITRTKENYVRRIWNLSKNRAGLAKYGFKTFTTAQLQRKFETIYDGFVRDMDLKVSGIVSSYGEIAGEVAVIKANKNFIQASMDIGILTTDSKKSGYIPLNASGFSAWARKAGAKIKTRPDEPGLLQIDTHGRKIFFAPPTLKYGAIKPGATRVSRYFPTMEMAEEWIEERDEPYRIDRVQQADVFEKVTLYAPERIGEMLNQMTRTAGGMFETPIMRSLLRFNAGIKGWILMSSFFHHMAGQRSWAFGVNHEIKDNLGKGNIVQAIKNVGTMVNSVSAHKRGLEKIQANSAQLALLVRQGLTLGKMQDWDEALLRE
ncbi:hypothetical protein KA005_22745, partial [bacterium]|nr:hypothetical protein [bacterium]